jgi:hypothetical protein
MRRFVIVRLLAAAALAAFGVGIVLVTWIDFSTPPPATTFADLAAPLPAESEADLAAAMPAIDELKSQRGSLLDGSILADSPSTPAPQPSDRSYPDLLRREARRLDEQAADLEDRGWYDEADGVREEAGRLRSYARENPQPLFSTTVNR